MPNHPNLQVSVSRARGAGTTARAVRLGFEALFMLSLTIRCPRCARRGDVSGPDPFGRFTILWDPRTGSQARGADRDTNVQASDLYDPAFGCGHDGATR